MFRPLLTVYGGACRIFTRKIEDARRDRFLTMDFKSGNENPLGNILAVAPIFLLVQPRY